VTVHITQCTINTNRRAMAASWKTIDKRYNEREMLIKSMDQIKKALPQLSSVRTCAMIGCGYGNLDLEFVGASGCLLNVKEIVAVEPDEDQMAELKNRVAKLLPTVSANYYLETAQSWKGADKLFEVVLIFDCLYFVSMSERPVLFKKLFDNVVASGGFVFMFVYPASVSSPVNSFGRLVNRLGVLYTLENTDMVPICDMMATAGFSLCYNLPVECEMNLEEPLDEFFSVIVDLAEGKYSQEEVRKVAREEFGDQKICPYTMHFLAFRKP